MDLIKVFLVAITGAIIYIYLKSLSSNLSGLVLIATGIIILLFSVDYIVKSVGFFVELSSKTGIDSNLFTILVKVILISYLADFTESVCNDIGATSISSKISLVTKLIIFVVAIPVYENLFEIVSGLIA